RPGSWTTVGLNAVVISDVTEKLGTTARVLGTSIDDVSPLSMRCERSILERPNALRVKSACKLQRRRSAMQSRLQSGHAWRISKRPFTANRDIPRAHTL